MCTRRSRKVIWDMINTPFQTLQLSKHLFLLSFSTCKHTSMASRAIVSNFFEEQRTPTTFLEIAVYNKWFRPVRGPAATQGNYPLPSRISVAILYRLFAYKLDCIKRRSRLRHVAMVVNFQQFLDLKKPWSSKYGRKKRKQCGHV